MLSVESNLTLGHFSSLVIVCLRIFMSTGMTTCVLKMTLTRPLVRIVVTVQDMLLWSLETTSRYSFIQIVVPAGVDTIYFFLPFRSVSTVRMKF